MKPSNIEEREGRKEGQMKKEAPVFKIVLDSRFK